MKIVHIISSPSAGGAEIYVRDLAIAMSACGHDVRIIFLNHAVDVGRDASFEDGFLTVLLQHAIGYDFIGFKARNNPIFGLLRVRQLCKDFRPDIIHCHLYYAALFTFLTTTGKLIYTHHNIKLCAPTFVYRVLDLRVATYIGICEACELMLGGVARRPIMRIDNAVEVQRVVARPTSHRVDSDVVSILIVGRLTEQKNLTLLLEALTFLDDLNFRVCIAGEGPDRSKLEAYVAQRNLRDKVVFLGNTDNVPYLMSRADIYAMSSAWEGLPIALIEATLTGLPVIVTNVGGCAEVVNHASNGFVVDTLEPEVYARSLRQLIESETLRKQLSDNALRNSARYRLSTSVNAHLALYQSLTCHAL